MSGVPSEPPPPYTRVDPKSTGVDPSPTHRREARNGITPERRRSMEDESRQMPSGWARQLDSKTGHHFYVDTKADPPRSIWHHPYDDDQFLSTLPSAERERLQTLTRHSSIHDIVAESSDDEAPQGKSTSAKLPPRPAQSGKPTWGRKMKDKITGSTHEQREAERKKREEEERLAYQAHLEFRRAMQKAMETGQPQLIGKDRSGKDVYVEPPNMASGYGYGSTGRGYSPYSSGMYQNPNARYLRPQSAYSRPYGGGYGGGYGLPLMGGLAGGLLLGDMMGGGMGMGMGGMGMGGMGMGGMGL